jgi:hypothetical protein
VCTVRVRTVAHRLNPASTADTLFVDLPLLLIAILASIALAIGMARVVLSCAFHLMHEGLPFTFHWRPVIFASALFWCWYLAPAIAGSRAVATVIRLVSIDTVHANDGAEPPRGRTGRPR